MLCIRGDQLLRAGPLTASSIPELAPGEAMGRFANLYKSPPISPFSGNCAGEMTGELVRLGTCSEDLA